MTSALPSCVLIRLAPNQIQIGALTLEVKAIELYEFPNEIPIAIRWAGSACALIFAECLGPAVHSCRYVFRWFVGAWTRDSIGVTLEFRVRDVVVGREVVCGPEI